MTAIHLLLLAMIFSCARTGPTPLPAPLSDDDYCAGRFHGTIEEWRTLCGQRVVPPIFRDGGGE